MEPKNNKAEIFILAIFATGAATGATLITGNTQPDGYELNVTTLQPEGVQPTELKLRANVTDLDPIYDAALVYWNATNQDTSNEIRLSTTFVSNEKVTEAPATGLKASIPYTTKAYVEPIIVADSKLISNAADKTEKYAFSENTSYSWIGKGFTPESRKNQQVVDSFRKLYGLNEDSVVSAAPFVPPPPNISSKTKTGSTSSPDASGLAFNPDGTKMFVSNNDVGVITYRLNEPFNLSAGKTKIGEKVLPSNAAALAFSPDGTKMFVTGGGITGYRLDKPFEPSAGVTKTIETGFIQDLTPAGLAFSPDGTKVTVSDANRTKTFSLNEPFNLSTTQGKKIGETDRKPVNLANGLDGEAGRGLTFSPDGTKMFASKVLDGAVAGYRLREPFDPSTLKKQPTEISAAGGDSVTFSPDGTKMFVGGFRGGVTGYRIGE